MHFGVVDCIRDGSYGSRKVLGKPAREGESPVHEKRADKAGSRVPRDTWNLVGKSGDHPVSLNTP